MLRILTAAAMEHEDTEARLRASFSLPLHDAVRRRLLKVDNVDEATAQAVADAIVGAVVYPILCEGRSYTRRRAELTTRIIVGSLAN
jgi:hypothetical protein